MDRDGEVIEGTAQEVMARLARVPAGAHVRVLIGRPSLSLLARRLQQMATSQGMTDKIHDELMEEWKHDR